VGEEVYLGGIKLRALLLFRLRILGNTDTKLARVLSIKGFAHPDFHTFGFGVFDQHANPSRNLPNRPVPPRNLQEGQSAKDNAKTRPHRLPVGMLTGSVRKGNAENVPERWRLAFRPRELLWRRRLVAFGTRRCFQVLSNHRSTLPGAM
jgi:hypothetical protein